jgi:hypothetical protein
MFLSDISDDPIWNWYVRDTENLYPGDNGTMAFCDAMEEIEQPGRRGCPPKKGFAIISIHTFVPWFVGTVRQTDSAFPLCKKGLTDQGNITVKFDAKTKEGERIYCLDGDFELDYPHDTRVQR